MAKLFERNRPPRHVFVLGHKIKVRVVKELIDSDDSDLLGAFNSETKTIFIKKHEDWRSCLLHEILHAAIYLSGSGEGLTRSKEEGIVLALEHALGPIVL